MRGLSAIGMTLGLVMMTAPLWLPRLTGDGAQVAAGPVRSLPQPGSVAGQSYEGMLRALGEAQGAAGVQPGLPGLPQGAAPGQAPSPADVARMMAEVCRGIAAGGQTDESACRRNLAAAARPPEATAPPLPQIETRRRPGRAPDAKFVKVER